jgi:hypothetical protein
LRLFEKRPAGPKCELQYNGASLAKTGEEVRWRALTHAVNAFN